MDLALKSFNNLKAEKEWDVEPKKDADDAKFLALSAQFGRPEEVAWR